LAGVPIVIGTLPGLGSLYADNDLTTRMVRALYEPLQKLACHVSELTTFQNSEDAQLFVSQGIVPAHKAMVIPGSGVPTDHFDPMTFPESDRDRIRSELNIPPEALLVTMVSRLIRTKGVLEFAKAAQIVREQCPRSEFLLVGPSDGDSPDPLTPVEIAALSQAVTWAGERRDIPAVFAASDIAVLPSSYREGIPRVLLEAASMGLPLVTTDSPGCNEVVEDGLNGFLVPGRDPEALAQAIIRLIESPGLRRRFGKESRLRAVERFDLSKVADQTRSVYLDLLARKGLLNEETT
jgi:N,N'-diacetylbacillosaminyl-diphospho-undecaprenol alpha-1,3-N-acetylgalactosaminyltransferase